MADRVLTYLARHGNTDLTDKDIIQGQYNDMSINDTGRDQAKELRAYFAGKNIGPVIHSGLKDANETADIISNGTASPDTDLRPLNRGVFGGQPNTKATKKRIHEYLDQRTTPIPGGESLNDFHNRVLPAVNGYADQGAANLPPVLVVHGSVFHAIGDAYNDDHKSSRVEHGGVAAIMQRPDGSRYATVVLHPTDKSDKTT